MPVYMKNLVVWLTLVLCAFLTLAAPTDHALDEDTTICQHRHGIPIGSTHGKSTNSLCIKLLVSTILVLLGGLFAGLTLGLMGLDELHLRVLAAASDNPKEKEDARKVLQLMHKGRHWVLVVSTIAFECGQLSLLLRTILLYQVPVQKITNESLPVFLDGALGGGIPAVLISTASIESFLKQFAFDMVSALEPILRYDERGGLSIYLSPAPVAYPIAKILDYALGTNEAHMYKKSQLKSFLQLHRTGAEPLQEEEVGILNSVLELGAKHVETIMTPMKDVVQLSADAILDQDTLATILASGCSRIPVYDPSVPSAYIGLLLVKKLLQYDHLLTLPVRNFPLSVLPEAHPSISCFQALDYFQTGRAHLLLISQTPGIAGGAIGIVTLEDIIEEIIAEEIVDETDLYEDNVSKRTARRLATATVMQGIVERSQQDDGSVSSCGSTLAGLEDAPFKEDENKSYLTSSERGKVTFKSSLKNSWADAASCNTLKNRNYGAILK
ncbi:hypothetical protein DFH05DRAFT_1519565 [Lentinula detonsa]|uniref:Protein MAM3 n=1 Tax=Lentinula detonsa TaxID=2804962 RepID=A0A9W8PCT7_9AGAR|nr:hypothetical protein DFH05DRAFT_1519565 [Lentinula detonsa]